MRMKRTRAILVGMGLFLILGIPIVIALGQGGWTAFLLHNANPFTYLPETDAAIHATHANGAQIVAALERWKVKTGSYPASLSALVPSELASIPRAAVGSGNWSYNVLGDQSFELRVWVGPDYESDWWMSGAKEWNVDR